MLPRIRKIRGPAKSKITCDSTVGSHNGSHQDPSPSSSPPKNDPKGERTYASSMPRGRRISLFSTVAQDLKLNGDELSKLRLIRATVDAAFDPMFTFDSMGGIVMANEAAMAQFGYKYDELIGSNISIICASGHANIYDYIHQYLQTGQKRIIETLREVQARRKDGTEFTVSLGMREITIDEENSGEGEQQYFCAYLRDLTEQKSQENKILNQKALIQGMIDSSFDPMFCINEKGIINVVNQAAISMFGWSREEFIGENISMICGGGHGSLHDGYIKRYLQTGQSCIIGRRRQVTARRKDGSEFEADLGLNEVNVDGKRIWCGFTRDLTKQLLDQQTMLNQENYMQDAFFPTNKNKLPSSEKSDGLLPGAITPPLTPPSTPSSPAKAFTCPRPPRMPRTPRQRSVSLGKHTFAANLEALSI